MDATQSNEPTWADMLELDLPAPLAGPANSNGAAAEAPVADTSTPTAPSSSLPAMDAIVADSTRLAAVPTTSHAYLSAEERAEIRRREGVTFVPATTVAPVAPATTAPASAPPLLSGSDMIAGAAASGNAVLCGWDGSGELRRAQIAERVAAAGLSAFLLPIARTSRAQLGRAIADACGSRYEFRAERGERAAAERPYAARWSVGAVNHGAEVGAAYGRCVATVTLAANGELIIDTDDHALATQIREEHRRLVDEEVYSAADTTAWLRNILCNVFGGVKLGGIYYVPRSSAARAESLCTEMATIWGTNWISPALPVATTEQLRHGLARGLADEANTIISKFTEARDTAAREHYRGDRRSPDLSARAATTFLRELRTVAERIVSYAALLGAALVAPLRASVNAAIEQANALLDDTAQRASLIGDEIEDERSRGIHREHGAAS